MTQAIRITVELMPYVADRFNDRDGISGTVQRTLDADRYDNEANAQRLVSQLVAEAFERAEAKRVRQQEEANAALDKLRADAKLAALSGPVS